MIDTTFVKVYIPLIKGNLPYVSHEITLISIVLLRGACTHWEWNYLENIRTIKFWDLEIWIFVNVENFLQKSTLQSKTHNNWVLKNFELYWGTSPKLIDHLWDLKLCYVVSSSSWLWWKLLKSLPNYYDYKLKRTFG